MATHRRALIFTAFLLQLLMVGATASPLAEATNPLGDADKMNQDLLEALDGAENTDVLPVIYQLNSEVTAADKAVMKDLGFQLLGDAPLVDGGLVEGTAQAVRSLSAWDLSLIHI